MFIWKNFDKTISISNVMHYHTLYPTFLVWISKSTMVINQHWQIDSGHVAFQ